MNENEKVFFDGGYIYICDFCQFPDILKERIDLENHLKEEHANEDVDDTFLDGPMFKIRKIQFYLRQVDVHKKQTIIILLSLHHSDGRSED